MVQTQLASMYIGNPYAFDAEDRLQGVSSKVDATIHILDGQSNQGVILDYITAKNIISDAHKKSLEDTLETYNFITFADKRFSEYLEKRNRFIIPDEDGTSREFVMYEGAKYKDSEGYKAQVFAHASYLELKKATVLYPESYKGTASQHAGRTLNGTGWQVGIVEVFGNKTLSRSKHTNPYEFLKHIAKEYGAELKFRVEHDGNKIVGRYVDLLERVGDWRGREVVFGKDLDGIRRVEKQNIVTALLGLGPEDEDGNRIEVLVEDEDALKRWGRVDEFGKLHHLIEAYEIQSERDNMTVTEARRYTRTALDKRINESVTYECSIIDLENVPGMANKEIRHGDTIRIKDEHFNPPLYLEARVFEFDRSIKSNAKKDIKLGDFTEFTEEEVNVIWIMLQREIRKKIDIDTLKEYAEPKKVESDTPPEIKEGENPVWVDTSKTPKVPHVVVGGEWVKMSPTTPEEVNAYNKSQVDKKDESVYQDGTIYADQKAAEEARLKAEQALKDAKAFSENADNINKGVIDVGAVPLRTSATGARLEWDGVNGLIQYDSSGNAVSWLDLDANAHFANAFLSGRVEASDGFFGDNLRLRDSKLEIIRPDGGISTSDGMVRESPTINGIDPMFMTNSKQSGGGLSQDAFQKWSGYYESRVDFLDGRYTGFEDVRDSDYRNSLRIQRYYFIHSARYFVLTYRTVQGAGTNLPGGLHRHLALIYDSAGNKLVDHNVPANTTETVELIADLGTPNFKSKWLDFRIGWAKSWGGPENYIRFRINNVVQTDFI
ncbi:MAG TPA: phage tail spike protein [Atopostipes sp.]|nr:phage tail spike protein [Atopostipes sp.]